MNSIYEFLKEDELWIILLAFIFSVSVAILYLIPDPPQPYTTSSDVEARKFIRECEGGVLILEKDGVFTMECGK